MRSYATDHRTPLAWMHRDMTLQQQHRHHRHQRHHHRPLPSPTITTTSSSDEREEVPMVRPPRRPGSRQMSQFSTGLEPHGNHHHHHPHTSPHFRGEGTLRSTRSVPALALATWDGEPCPVHGHGQAPPPFFPGATMRRHGSLFDMRPPMFGPPIPMDKKSFHGSMQLMGPSWPPYFMRPPHRPPFVIPAGAEPLPVRDPYRRPAYVPSKASESDYDSICCKGHLIVLWIILAVVTIGVILGIVLGVTIA